MLYYFKSRGFKDIKYDNLTSQPVNFMLVDQGGHSRVSSSLSRTFLEFVFFGKM